MLIYQRDYIVSESEILMYKSIQLNLISNWINRILRVHLLLSYHLEIKKLKVNFILENFHHRMEIAYEFERIRFISSSFPLEPNGFSSRLFFA